MTEHDFSITDSVDCTRRDFLKGATAATGALVLGFYLPAFRRFPLSIPVAPKVIYDPNVFLRIGTDNSVTLISKHFEMGQGATTGLATLVAEELDADWAAMRYVFAPNDPALYNNLFFGKLMGTGGSSSVAESWEQMRKAGAAARMMLVQAAAQRWKVPASEITVTKGIVIHKRSSRHAMFGELAEDAMRLPVPTVIKLKSPSEWTLIGTRLPRLDSVAKTTGRAVFGLDVQRPGMLTAVVKRPDLFGATVLSVDATDAKKVDGVVDVVTIPAGVAVIANDTWSAIRGRKALKVTWDTSAAEHRSTSEMLDEYRRLAMQPGLVAVRRGNATAGLARAVRTIDAEFTFPFLAHAPMEPINGVIEVRPDGAEIWAGSQLQSADMDAVARVLGLKPSQVKINTLLGGGSFGRRGDASADWMTLIASVAKVSGLKKPLRVVWTREDDIKGGHYRPMVLHRVKAGVDAQGRIAGWTHTIVSKSIFIGTPIEAEVVKNGVDESTCEGAADTTYAIPNFLVRVQNAQTKVPVLWFRSVGHTHTAHVMEIMMDELAHLAGKDPIDFRLALLSKQPRESAVIRLAAEKSGWHRARLSGGRGTGFAYHKSFDTSIAMVAEVTVGKRTVKVDRIVAAVDCGVPINPDVITAQIEGAIGFSLSSVLRNQITLDKGIVEQSNFDDYRPTLMREMPTVEVHIVKSAEDPSGIGEPGVPPVAPAIANAIFAATGKRLRSLPLDVSALE